MGWINGMTWERLGIKGHLSKERKYAQVQVQRVAQNQTNWQNAEKLRKRKGRKNQGVTSSLIDNGSTAMKLIQWKHRGHQGL